MGITKLRGELVDEARRNYDTRLYSGSLHGDVCHFNGIQGRCGVMCEAFGSKDECRETDSGKWTITDIQNRHTGKTRTDHKHLQWIDKVVTIIHAAVGHGLYVIYREEDGQHKYIHTSKISSKKMKAGYNRQLIVTTQNSIFYLTRDVYA